MPRFLLSRRWLGLLAFVLIFGAITFRAGLWQWHKLEHRIDRNEVIKQHYQAEPRPLDEVVAPGAKVDGESQEWTTIKVTGTYDPAGAASVKFRTRDGSPGVDVVVPLKLADGSAVLIDRGWMPSENSNRAPQLPTPPTGEVTVVGWLRPNNGAGGNAVRVNDGQIRAISSVGYDEFVSYPLRNGYLDMRTETPKSPSDLQPEPDPDLGQGPHFFYALQWWFFGLLGVVGFGWFMRDEIKASAAKPE